MKVVFSHGKESGPWGRKIKVLADIAMRRGFVVESIDYTDSLDPDVRVKRLDDYLSKEKSACVLVGSSMGGYVSAVNSVTHNVKGLFLLAPALYMPNYQIHHYPVNCNTVVVHGWSDNVIPSSNSVQFAQEAKATLHIIEGDHSLTAALPEISIWFERFLEGVSP